MSIRLRYAKDTILFFNLFLLNFFFFLNNPPPPDFPPFPPPAPLPSPRGAFPAPGPPPPPPVATLPGTGGPPPRRKPPTRKNEPLQEGDKMLRRQPLKAALAIGAPPLLGMGTAHAQTGKPVEWVVGFAAGGGSDAVARTVGGAFGKALGRSEERRVGKECRS